MVEKDGHLSLFTQKNASSVTCWPDLESYLVLVPRLSPKKDGPRFPFTQKNVNPVICRPDLESYLVLVYQHKRRLRPVNLNSVNGVYKRRL